MNALAATLALFSTLATAPDWVKPEDFKGKKILIACYYWEGNAVDSVPMNNVPAVLRKLGFTVDVLKSPPHLPSLTPYDEVWIVSGSGGPFDTSDAAKIKTFLDSGKGVYVMADNTPYIHEANVIGGLLHGISFDGAYLGDKTINVVPPGTIKKLIDEAMKKEDMEKLIEYRRAGWFNGKLYAEDHELLTGISQIYEGCTLSSMTASPDLEVIIRASDNNPLVSVSTKPEQRIVYDGGFTRLYYRWNEHAEISTLWYRNIAAYLLGKRRVDLAAPATGAQSSLRADR